MKKRILFIRTPEVEYNPRSTDLRSVSVGGLTVPLGVAYLAAVVREMDDWEVRVLDLYGEYYERFVNQSQDESAELLKFSVTEINGAINDYKPDVVGLSAPFLFQHSLIKELVAAIKKNFPALRLYLGGYATIIPEIVMQDIPGLDILFIGEAEKTLPLVLAAETSGDFSLIKGIGYRAGEKIFINKQADLIEDLDSLPFPAFDLLPLEKYKKSFGRNEFPVMTSRSCPFSCGFCSSRLYSKRGLRLRSTANLAAEMKTLREKYGLDFLLIRDDNFIVNRDHVKNFLGVLLKEGLVAPWIDSSGFHVNSVDEEILDLCKATGCTQIIFAVESGSPRVLKDIMNKNVDLDHSKKMAAYCRKIGLSVQCYFVIGNPGETKKEIMQTIDFANQMQVDHCTFSIATPFPGTRYWEIALEKGYLTHDANYILSMKYMETNMGTENFSPAWLKDTQYDANIRVNFLENRSLAGDLNRALKKYSGIFEQYGFHAVAGLIRGYLEGKLGDVKKQADTYVLVSAMLEKDDIKKAYGKYFDWDTAPTNDFRKWVKNICLACAKDSSLGSE